MYLLALLAACAAPEEPCNGAAALCDRPLADVVFPATHNAMSNAEEGWLGPNQNVPPRTQLADGVRGFLIDTHPWEGDVYACHTVCSFGATLLADLFGDFASFLDDHPREVLVFVMQDGVAPEDHEPALRESGLWDRLYTPNGAALPTLGELVELDQRVLLTRESGGPGPAWFPPFYDAIGWDTPYDHRTADDFGCDAFRGDPAHPVFQINHWISDPLPRPENAEIANTEAMLTARVDDCVARWGRHPTLLAVDFYDIGSLITVAQALNEAGPPTAPASN